MQKISAIVCTQKEAGTLQKIGNDRAETILL